MFSTRYKPGDKVVWRSGLTTEGAAGYSCVVIDIPTFKIRMVERSGAAMRARFVLWETHQDYTGDRAIIPVMMTFPGKPEPIVEWCMECEVIPVVPKRCIPNFLE